MKGCAKGAALLLFMNKKHTVAFVIVSLVGGSVWIARQMVTGGPPGKLRAAAIADFLCALALGLVALLLRLPKPRFNEIAANVVLGGTLLAAPFALALWASAHASAGIAAIIPAATPLVVTFLCDISWTAKNAAIAGLTGVILVVAEIVSSPAGQWSGIVVLLLAVMATAQSLVFAKRRLVHSHPVFSAALQLATAAVVLSILSVLLHGQGSVPLQSLWVPVAWISAGSCIVYPLYFWLLQRIRPDQLASAVWAQLMVSVMEGIFLLRPQISFRIVLGSAVIGGALTFLARSESENKLLTVRVTPASK
jgi:drug/metabolite transporter (DMT)-like permease